MQFLDLMHVSNHTQNLVQLQLFHRSILHHEDGKCRSIYLNSHHSSLQYLVLAFDLYQVSLDLLVSWSKFERTLGQLTSHYLSLVVLIYLSIPEYFWKHHRHYPHRHHKLLIPY